MTGPEPATGSGGELGGVDCHSHILPPDYVAELLATGEHDPALAGQCAFVTKTVPNVYPAVARPYLLDNVDNRLDALAGAGIGTQVLGAGSLLAFPDGVRHRAELVRIYNDALHEQARRRPDVFRVFANVPLPDVDAAVAETERVADRDTTAGFGSTTHICGAPIDDPRWEPLYGLWNELGATVFVHPDRFCVPGLMDRQLELEVGTQLDDTLAAVRLFRSGVLRRYPRVSWIVGHLGGALPFILGRLDEHWERDRAWHPLPDFPSRLLDGLYVDTAGHSAASIRFAAEILGAERMVFGSDFPMVHAHDLAEATAKVASACENPARRQSILRDNAVALLGAA